MDNKVYVNVYEVTRHYGGAEEGGWYYDWYECLECVPCRENNAEKIKDELWEEYKGMKYGDISSVLGGVDIMIYIEEKRCESQTLERPYYE